MIVLELDGPVASGPKSRVDAALSIARWMTPAPALAAAIAHDVADPLARSVDRMRRGDESGLADLYAACRARIFQSARAIVRRDEIAHEVVSVTFMQAWNEAARFDAQRGTVMAWLTRIARTRAFDALRRVQVVSRHEDGERDDERELAAGSGSCDPLSHSERSCRNARLRRALSRLSPMQRQVLSLTVLSGLSQDEASIHLGVPLGTVKSHARRGLASMRVHCLRLGIEAV